MGNTLVVDAVNGNDSTASVNGLPFLTVDAAIASINTNSLSNVTVWILPGTYTLASATSGMTIPATCSFRGLSTQTTKIVMNALNAGSTATMITMGENTRIEDLSLTMNSTSSTTNLIGMTLPGTTSVTSKLRTCVLTVNNSSVAVGTTTNVYGVYSAGTGALNAATFSYNCLKGSTINVTSNGGGNKFGIYQPVTGSGNQLSTRDLNVYVSAPTTLTSTGLYVGIYVDNAGSQIQTRSTSISGAPYSAAQVKLPVVAVATTNIALTGLLTVDGVTLVAGNRVLCTGQTSGAVNNGIYIVASGAWSRSNDMLSGSSAVGVYAFCSGGSTYTHTGWYCTNSSPATVGTTALTFSQVYAGGDILQNATPGNTTNGIQIGPGTDLVTKTACTHPFSTYSFQTSLTYGLNGTLNNGTRYLWPGTLTTGDTTLVFYKVQQNTILYGMFASLRDNPANSVTITVLLSNTGSATDGTATPTLMTVGFTTGVLSGSNYTTSVNIPQNSYIALQVVTNAAGSTADLVVELDLF